jgi:hypothetical protein
MHHGGCGRRPERSVRHEAQVCFLFGQEVYHYLVSSSQDGDTIASTVNAAKSNPQFIGVLTQCSVKAANLDRASVPVAFLQRVSQDWPDSTA